MGRVGMNEGGRLLDEGASPTHPKLAHYWVSEADVEAAQKQHLLRRGTTRAAVAHVSSPAAHACDRDGLVAGRVAEAEPSPSLVEAAVAAAFGVE